MENRATQARPNSGLYDVSLPQHNAVPTLRPLHEEPAQRWALAIAATVALLSFALLQLLHRLVAGTGADFRAMFAGASALGIGHDIYAPAIHFLTAGHLRHILDMPITPYVYPPPLAIALRPLTLLSPHVAQAVWDGLNVSMLAAIFVMVVRLSGARSYRELLLVGALYGFFPLNMGLGNGQVDLVITILSLCSYLLYQRGLLRRTGILLGIITLIKPTVGVIIVFFVCRRAWPVIAAYLSTLLFGAVVSLMAVGGKVLWEYRTVAAGWANAFGVLPLNQSVHGVLLRFLSPGLDLPPVGRAGLESVVAEALLALVVLGGVKSLLKNAEPTELPTGLLQFYAVFSVLLVGIPFTENIHLTWLIPGIGIMLVMMAQQGRFRPWHGWAVGSYLVLALPFAEMLGWRADASLLGRLSSGLECYGLVAMAAVFCYVAFSGKMLRQSGAEEQATVTFLGQRLPTPAKQRLISGAG